MPNVMFRQQADGLYCYIAKRDLEAKITAMEFESAECWGGRFELADGQAFYLQPLNQMPALPTTLRVTRADGDD
ncbi:putative nitrogen fixation protein NifT [Pseudaeromonas sharmana]|uniref:Nitrogen fixation protein NifT n=1 Tax=Pseudaeromonas sharmana TaxID=328412 RepID=A0ABV8CKA6_9GAMM